MKQFQIHKADLATTRIVEIDQAEIEPGEGEILVKVDGFGFSANNITYTVAGETLGYWQFFPPVGEDAEGWGVLPVWGFAEVVSSNLEALKVGERLFGYFPPATHLLMSPEGISDAQFFDGAGHRAQLPKGYNIYRRVDAEPGYDKAGDAMRMLLFPLYITSFCLWDLMKEHGWYGAKQIIIVSASSKTSIGLDYALHADDEAPEVVGLTSAGNMAFVESLGIYDTCLDYGDLDSVEAKPTAIVDMSGNAEVLGRLHAHLGANMVRTLNVGLTHWESPRKDHKINRDRSEFFFAPSQIQKRMKEWGAEGFGEKSSAFIQQTAAKSESWLELKKIDGLDGVEKIYSEALRGDMRPQEGLIVEL